MNNDRTTQRQTNGMQENGATAGDNKVLLNEKRNCNRSQPRSKRRTMTTKNNNYERKVINGNHSHEFIWITRRLEKQPMLFTNMLEYWCVTERGDGVSRDEAPQT